MLQLGPVQITIRYDGRLRPSGKGRKLRSKQQHFDDLLRRTAHHVAESVEFSLKTIGLEAKEFGEVVSKHVFVDVQPYTTTVAPVSTLSVEITVDDRECYRDKRSELLTDITASILNWLGAWPPFGLSLMVNLAFRPVSGMYVDFNGRTIRDWWNRDNLRVGDAVPLK
jgi:hypothetical protein